MIDNFEKVKEMFYFNEANNMFFHLQIVQRAKDHKGENKKVRESAIKTYFIRSREHLDKVKEEVVFLCGHYGARAYINIAGKDFSALQNLMLAKLAEYNLSGTVRDPRRILNSAAGELKSRCPRWVVDIDDISIKDKVLEWLDNYFKVNEHSVTNDRYSIYLYAEVPTKSGIHLISQPFNLNEFHDTFPDVDVHKNSMGTLLYYPNSLDKPTYCCSKCGGTNIQVQAWVDANTNEYIDDVTSNPICWCKDCGYTKLKEI